MKNNGPMIEVCPNCGKEYRPGFKYCRYCGAKYGEPGGRLYLALAEDMGGGEAVVVVTKVDLREAGDDAFLDELRATVGGRVPILEISSLTGEGLDGVRAYAQSGRTLAFVGSSGVGKSTLLNTLAGAEWAAVQEVQEWSGKGRHTTTSRELVMLPSGAMVIDTPGIREIGMLGEMDAVQAKGEASHRWRK